MNERCTLRVDGVPLEAIPGESLAAAMLRAGHIHFRRSCTEQARGPLCGMGICYECQVRVGNAWVRACLEPVTEGMEVRTHD